MYVKDENEEVMAEKDITITFRGETKVTVVIVVVVIVVVMVAVMIILIHSVTSLRRIPALKDMFS